MRTYSLDLRQRIVDAVERHLGRKREIARWFGVDESFLYKLLRQRRERGDIAPLPHGGGAPPKLTPAQRQQVAVAVAATPDATLEELREQLTTTARVRVSLTTVWREVQKVGWTRKKKTKQATQADAHARAVFQEQQSHWASDELIFLDEFGINLTMTRTYARAPQGQRAYATEPFKEGSNISVISALGLQGIRAPFMIEGAINGEIFECYVRQLLVPCLRPGQEVWMDNVKFHHSVKAIELIEATGARVRHLPTYSPDFNPLEAGISKIKERLRAAKARTHRTLTTALAEALESITTSDIRGWFTHCGYVLSAE